MLMILNIISKRAKHVTEYISRLNLLETPQRSGRRESGGGKLRVTFSEEELEIHDEDDNVDDNERTDDSPARWSKLSR